MAKKRRKKVGLSPGSVVFTGKRKVELVSIHYLEYNPDYFNEKEFSNQSITGFHKPKVEVIQWYDIRGLHDTVLIEEIGKLFQVHPLVLEDIADTNQRPKFEEYEQGLFISTRALEFDPVNRLIKTEQITIYVGDGFVLSFQEDDTDLFSEVRTRIHLGKGRIRRKDATYLAYAILDAVVDHYFIVLDGVEENIENLEAEIIVGAQKMSKSDIHHLKQEMLTFRKTISPLREAISKFAKSDHPLIDDTTQVFVRDLYDHTIQIMDIVDTYRDTLNGLQDLYLSEISFRMNQVMQVLTVVTTIFVPLSFLAGLYGMNFAYMPELGWKYSYFVLLLVMFSILVSMLFYFKKKKWF